MITYIIRDLSTIEKITGKNYNVILLHIDNVKKVAKYQSEYTAFELTERLDYNRTINIIK